MRAVEGHRAAEESFCAGGVQQHQRIRIECAIQQVICRAQLDIPMVALVFVVIRY
jgi:hypothetical protein